MLRLVRLMVAWCVGCGVYLVAALLWTYDGILSMIFQPICAAVVSTVAIGVVMLAGLVLRVRPIGRFWQARPHWAAALALGCLVVMVFGSAAGLTASYEDPETGRAFEAIHPVAALLGYVLLLFAIAHWPAGLPASGKAKAWS